MVASTAPSGRFCASASVLFQTGQEAKWYLNVEPDAPERAVCVPHGEFEAEALCNEELEVKDIARCRLGDMRRVLLERYGVVRRLRGKK